MTRYARTVPTALEPAAAVERLTALLAEQGFGILTRIDIHEVFARKLGITRPPYIVLGACNPNFANAALQVQPEMGILLPCNVVVEGNADGAGCRVHVTEPEALFSLVDDPRIAPIMADVRDRLMRVADAVAAAPEPAR
jgi:uncharacterized protein (DUF302 family)